MSRLHSAVGLATAVLLGGALLPSALAEPAESSPIDYSLRVNAGGETTSIPDTMHGVFFEDINDAADGGIYAELVRNRSFEYDTVDNPSYTPMTGWSTTSVGGAEGSAEVIDDAQRLNENNRRYLRLRPNAHGRAAYGVTNAGYHSGMSLERGEKYDFSIWARSDQPGGTPLTVTATDGSGSPVGRTMRIRVRGDQWTEYTKTFVAHSDTDTGGLRVLGHGSGTLRLDMVSLFPRDTFKGEPNGLREDLARKIEALNPGFLRFPGGCLVNTGSHESYQAPDWERRRSYQWKDTVGPVEQRPTNANFWGYNQSYGLGFYEYFRFAENIGAMPLPVVPALVTGCGENEATHDPQLLRRHIQDTLDLIQFANGSVDTEWGAKRAAMGHPEPFGLTHLAVGNEENLPEDFYEHFEKFRDAIEQRYPGITVVANSGPDDSGAVFDRAWELAREQDAEMVDEHYYNNPQWFLENNRRYDSYDRSGPKVSLTEYASEGNRFYNALVEASFMTGLERNADVVRMSSYAPLLAHEDDPQWTPDMIWFDNHRSWGSASYEVQKLFGNNVGDEVVPSEASSTPVEEKPISGAVGLSTWNTSAAYDDVRVTSADGETLLADDFSGDASKWSGLTGTGDWSIQDGAYVQSDASVQNTMVTAGDKSWSDYDLHLTATKRAGSEGFLVAFGVEGTDDYYWWNLGGWNNTRSAVQKTTAGSSQTVLSKDTTIETGREYDIRVEVRGRKVTLFLDGEKWGSFTDEQNAEPFRQVVTRDEKTGELIVKVVNAQDNRARTRLDIDGAPRLANTARLTTLQGDPQAVNTAESRPIKPEKSVIRGVDENFSHTFPANSITVMRIRTQGN
ncbi:Carbohydrate binding domain-containing protein [Actinopolyspora xinjiangensis]|uniref:non-reducing end alpha-L-arabinofuranosidase n=1 Tax=Actinopolyspora xinjiangensis TaxID=405564 RepID=A0A1H0NBP5_9ACTN|nr:alpha-L-arabinofuranosidase C-terminal domain-containing protein [Actinopolyspora xinjiangensis]SDO90132.1 Carbohydrate binding domain-containing protein [Actinopolyspora xinjiangensis]